VMEQRNRVSPPHGGEVPKEYLQSLTIKDVVDQGLNRNTCAAKYRSTAQDFRVDRNRQVRFHSFTISESHNANIREFASVRRPSPPSPGLI